MISNIFKEDIDDVLGNENIPWMDMRNSVVFITGVTGLIGSILAHVICAANKKYGLDIKIIGCARDISRGEMLQGDCEIEFISHDINFPINHNSLPCKIDYIFHCAAITSSAHMVAKPIDVINTSVIGTNNILEFAKNYKCKSFVYLSSMEIYGQTDTGEIDENDLGYLDLLNPRSSYPESKRLCENLCIAYATQHKLSVKIVRPSLTFGAGVPNVQSNNRVFMQFARKAISLENIELHTEGNSILDFSYTTDLASALMIILLKGENSNAYNVANPSAAMRIRDMAYLVANDICDGKIKVIKNVPENINKKGYASDKKFVLNINKLNSLGWKPKYNLFNMYRRMIDDWLESSR